MRAITYLWITSQVAGSITPAQYELMNSSDPYTIHLVALLSLSLTPLMPLYRFFLLYTTHLAVRHKPSFAFNCTENPTSGNPFPKTLQ
jgi:hypothetical protein